jgi:hypothetical protein
MGAIAVIGLAALSAVLAVVAARSTRSAASAEAASSATAASEIPGAYLTLYQQAGREYAVPWPVLAAIGSLESDHGRSRVYDPEMPSRRLPTTVAVPKLGRCEPVRLEVGTTRATRRSPQDQAGRCARGCRSPRSP